jgi:soluble lytic murein transglycosylase
MMTGSWVRIFRDLSFKLTIAGVCISACLGAVVPEKNSVAALATDYRETNTPASRLALISYIKQHPKDQSGALANFALGMIAFDQKNFPDAILYLKAAQPLLPALGDYTSFYIASAEVELKDDAAAIAELSALHGITIPVSPLAPKITMLEAQALIRTRSFNEAIQALRAHFPTLPQPDADAALAQAYEGQGELAQAATLYQRIYYTKPATKFAVDAAASIERLKASMGKAYPPPGPQLILTRGDQWMAAKQYAKAKQEYHDIQPLLIGLPHDQAVVRVGAAELLGGNAAAALRYLKELRLARSEATAERSYYLQEAGRKTGVEDAAVAEAFRDLEKYHPASPWRLKALVSAGNAYLTSHKPDKYTPLFRAAFEKFPNDSTTPYSHWRIAWDAYLGSKPEARDLMREQLKNYPDDQRAASALYFLGRLAEGSQEFSVARAYYERLQRIYPHYYYGTLGAGRLADPLLSGVQPAAEVSQWLDGVAFPVTPDYKLEEPAVATAAQIDRARLLTAAGFRDWAVTELRFGANHDGQQRLLAIELARTDPTLAISLRHIKALTPEYLLLDYEQAPRELWGYLFPMPYRETILKNAKENELDPYLVAGLIRQESEFNPEAVSRARALGLTQLMPATGGMMARRAGIAGFQSRMLFDPQISLKLGTSYLRSQLDLWNGSLEQTLAAYNAGPGRVKQWTSGETFREPAEFVESIPFNETREYVQSVMRNAAVYRQLYTSQTPPPQPANALTSTHAVATSAPAAGSKSGAGAKPTVKRKSSGSVSKLAK